MLDLILVRVCLTRHNYTNLNLDLKSCILIDQYATSAFDVCYRPDHEKLPIISVVSHVSQVNWY